MQHVQPLNVPVRELLHVGYWASAWVDRVGLLSRVPGCQPFVGELTLKSVRQPRMRHHGKAAQPMVRRGHGLPAGGPGAPRALP